VTSREPRRQDAGDQSGSARRRLAALAVCLTLSLAFGCATVQQPQRSRLHDPDAKVQSCARWFAVLDAQTSQAGVRDAGAFPVAGFPYLRVDRYTASLVTRAARDPEAFEQWVALMRRLDRDARRAEAANLPPRSLEVLELARPEIAQRSEECAERLRAADLHDPAEAALLSRGARVPDHYLGWRRAVGLYPIVRFPFLSGVRGWQREAQDTLRRARAGERPAAPLRRYLPPQAAVYTRPEVAALLARAASEPLGVPRLTGEERDRLFATFAPVLEIETTADYDRPGALTWAEAGRLRVDASRPTVYRKLSYARYGSGTLLQLAYVAWFSERPKRHALDLLGGRLDGIIWRVTLADDGEPVLFDSIHPCGCFHMFFPTPRAEALPAPGRLTEWAFVPADLPALADGARIGLQAQTRTHYLRDVGIDPGGGGTRYALADYDELRALPQPTGGSRSAFAPDGLMPGTARAERFVFWPMGVVSAGAMRQWGTHATAFVGRRHFDDADLVERRFAIR